MSLQKKLEKLGVTMNKVDPKAPKYYYWRFVWRGLDVTITYKGTQKLYYSANGPYKDCGLTTKQTKRYYKSLKHFVDTGEFKL